LTNRLLTSNGGIAAKWSILVTNYHHTHYYSDTLE